MTLEEFQKMLAFHDWYYEYADGPAYYQGRASWERILEAIDEGGEDFRKAYEEAKGKIR